MNATVPCDTFERSFQFIVPFSSWYSHVEPGLVFLFLLCLTILTDIICCPFVLFSWLGSIDFNLRVFELWADTTRHNCDPQPGAPLWNNLERLKMVSTNIWSLFKVRLICNASRLLPCEQPLLSLRPRPSKCETTAGNRHRALVLSSSTDLVLIDRFITQLIIQLLRRPARVLVQTNTIRLVFLDDTPWGPVLKKSEESCFSLVTKLAVRVLGCRWSCGEISATTAQLLWHSDACKF